MDRIILKYISTQTEHTHARNEHAPKKKHEHMSLLIKVDFGTSTRGVEVLLVLFL